MCKSSIYIFFYLITVTHIKAQQVSLYGFVQDSTQAGLSNANLLAFPENNDEKVQFAISDNTGKYNLSLKKGVPYTVEISHLGYGKKSIRTRLDSDSERDIILNIDINELDEVVVRYKIPIEVKKDTIIYDPKAFINGKERKLREVLKKLPGLEVDRLGNVTIKGKKVTTVLVDNKQFFTGDSKLAVNNIPADVVDQIEILENYNGIALLKGLEDSDAVALNVRLKKDRDNFTFGDIEVGGGITDRYSVHPNIFYYSPKTSLNFIGDANNTGKKSFTLNDYVEFEGGFGQMANNPQNYIKLLKGDFARFLLSEDFKENKSQFKALSLRQSLGKRTDLNGYIIANNEVAESESRVLNSYNRSDGILYEDRNTKKRTANSFVIGKFTIEHKPSSKKRIAYNSLIKWNRNNALEDLVSKIGVNSNFFDNSVGIKTTMIKQNIEYTKKLSKSQTINATANLIVQSNKNGNIWSSDSSYLENFLTLSPEEPLDVFQNINRERLALNFIVKDYWVINNLNHLYLSMGGDFIFEDFSATSGQDIGGNKVPFETVPENALAYRYRNLYSRLEHKFLTGICTVKTGLLYNFYLFGNTQGGIETDQSTQFVFPTVDVSFDFNKSKELNLGYQVQMSFPESAQVFENSIISSFNQIFQGERNLTNERFHSYSLNYTQFNLFGGLNINAALFYNKKSKGIKQRAVLDGIDQLLEMTMFDLPENNVRATAGVNKKIGRYKFTFNANKSYSEFYQLVNTSVDKNITKTLDLSAKVQTFFETVPNVEISYRYAPSRYMAAFGTSKFKSNTLLINIRDEFLKNFQLDTDYSREVFRNVANRTSNTYEIFNASIFYQLEDSSWGFELGASNIFNTQRKQSSSFSDFIISDRSSFVLPRMVLLKLSYKL